MFKRKKFAGFTLPAMASPSANLLPRLAARSSDILKNAVALALAMIALPSANTHASDAVLVEFTSEFCGHCRAMQPVVQSLARAGVPVRRVDVRQEPHLASRYGIRQTPTYVVVSDGKEIARLVGTHSQAEIQAALSTPSGPLIPTGAATRSNPGTAFGTAPQIQPPSAIRQPGFHAGEPMPSTVQAKAVEHAQAATVRLKVYDSGGYDTGTGTIIDVHNDEALVITCGHLFRETKFSGRIAVDLFVGGQTKTVPGQLIDYDADNHDIALVSIRPGFPVQPVPVIASNDFLQNGQPIFSFGCDQGADPSRRDSRITGINKYNQHMGASNIEIAVAPVQGRSGGGLFDARGRLIGICNAANYQSDVGIYTGPGSIRWQLDRVQLSRLYQATENAARNSVARGGSVLPNDPPRIARTTGGIATPASQDKEVIVIIRERGAPESASQIMSIRPTDDVMTFLQQNAQPR